MEWLIPRARRVVLTGKPIHSAKIADLLLLARTRERESSRFLAELAKIALSTPSSAAGFVQILSQSSPPLGSFQGFYRSLKSIVEPILALTLILLLSPLLVLIALAVKWTSRGPVFYLQTRTGLGGVYFEILKFRSMRSQSEISGPRWASADPQDPRLTSIGRILRADSPRRASAALEYPEGRDEFHWTAPRAPLFISEINEDIPSSGLRTRVKPGVTGWAQVRSGYANTIEDCGRKLEFDLYYLINESPVLDLKIMLCTLKVLFSGGTEAKKRELKSTVRESLQLKTTRQQAQAIAE